MARAHLLVSALLACAPLVYPAATPAHAAERYTYRATADDDGAVETHRVEIDTTTSGVVYRFTVTREGATETGAVTTLPGGAFVRAWRAVDGDDGSVDVDSLWIDGSELHAWRLHRADRSEKTIDLPDDRPLAVDASLLLWMRGFPFGAGTRREVFMADWSRRTVNVVVREAGVETVEVPAGRFECYRMEVAVKVLFFRPRVTFWVTTAPPHFLVRHRGRRGPFTPVFDTTLESVGDGD